ncbi:MAG: DUF92 domain-containing protein [Bacteroidota bacterium]|nr:DUF92 domain-containing protein [Bacteroidota bacterium]
MTITATDLLRLGAVCVSIAALLLLSEMLRKRMGWPDEVTRKSVHIITGILIFFAPSFFPRSGAVVFIAALFVAVNAVAYARGWLRAMHHGPRKSFGTVYYPLALLLLALPLWDHAPDLVVAAILVMALGDGAAGIVGETARQPRPFNVSSDRKSLEGSTAMFAGSVAALLATVLVHGDRGMQLGAQLSAAPLLFFAVLLSVALFATAWEAASSRGLDNLTVPLMSAFALHLCLAGSGDDAALRFITGSGLGLLVGVLAYASRMLTISGAVATFLLAATVFGVGGWRWTLPLLTFFVLSSLLSKWRDKRKGHFESMFEKGGTRDAGQVAANGAIVGVLAVAEYLFGGNIWYLLSLAAVASVTADTWGTELGVLARRKPRSIRTGRRVPTGTSGGMTLAGTTAGALGAATVTATALPFIAIDASTFLLITALGVAGSLADSLLGATLQAQYHCPLCGRDTEKRFHCGMPARRTRGHPAVTNDAINFLAAFAAVALGALLLM